MLIQKKECEMEKSFVVFGGFISLALGSILLFLHATDPQAHLSIPGLAFVVLGLITLAFSTKMKK